MAAIYSSQRINGNAVFGYEEETVIFGGGGWAAPGLRRYEESLRKKKKDDDEKERLLAEVIEVPIPTKPDTRRKLTLEQIIGPQAAAQMSLPDLTHEIETIKRKKRQRMEEEMLLMY